MSKIELGYGLRTSYDYIEMINNNDRNKYVSILLDIYTEYKHVYINEFIKFIAIAYTMKSINDDVKRLIKHAIKSNIICKGRMTAHIIDILLYLQTKKYNVNMNDIHHVL